MYLLIALLNMLIQIVWWAVIIYVILSWLIAFNILNMSQPFVYRLWASFSRMADPVFAPIRRVLPDLGGIDISPIVLLLALELLRVLVNRELAPMLLR